MDSNGSTESTIGDITGAEMKDGLKCYTKVVTGVANGI